MIFAIIDFGRYVYYVQILNNAAREGARYAIVHGSNSFQPVGPTADDPKIRDVVRSYAIGVIGQGTDLTVHSCWKTPPTSAGFDPCNPDDPSILARNTRESRVRVTASYEFRPIIPLVPIPPITITGESTLVINN